MEGEQPGTDGKAAIFRRLPPGRGGLSAEDVSRNQKARLQGAMIEAVARHGYPDTTLRELIALAGVSKAAFYQHYSDKEECFLDTFDAIFAEVGDKVGEAFGDPGDFRERLSAALGTFMQTVVEEPAAARLVAVESLTLGPVGVEHRAQSALGFEALIQQSFDHSPSETVVPPLTVRAVVAGIRGVAYRRLRSGEESELPGLVPQLVNWALGFQTPESAWVSEAIAAAKAPLPSTSPSDPGEPSLQWSEPPDSPASRERLSQRERILRASARVGVERGYRRLSIPAISAEAGVSNQTFYEHFTGKREAFLASFELLAAEALAATETARAAASPRPRSSGVAIRALLEHIARNDLFARLGFFELAGAGPPGLDRADAVLDSFTALLVSEADGAEVPTVTRELVGTSIWSVIEHEVAHGRRAQLAELAPDVVSLALVPIAERP